MRFLRFASAPSPWHLRCGACGEKLQMGRRRWTAVLLGGAWGGILGFVCVVLFEVWGLPSVPLSIAMFAGGILIAEGTYYRAAKRFGLGLAVRHLVGQQGAPPNGGPADLSGSSGVSGGPPSVS